MPNSAFASAPSRGDGELWCRYGALQWHVLSDSVRSFNSIHDRTKRCETGHILDDTWISDDLAAEYGLDLDNVAHAGGLWREVTQSYALVGRLGEWKFGPNFVELETSVDNIRITTFFAGEFEVPSDNYFSSVTTIRIPHVWACS